MPKPSLTSSPTSPRFRQITEHLKSAISSGHYEVHAALPSERMVAEQFDVSRMTARRALEALESEGLAYSSDRRGRFVSPQRLRFDISNTVSFAADAQRAGTELEIMVLSSKETTASASIAVKLSVKTGTPIYEYCRVFRVKGHTTFLETEYVLQDKFPNFLDLDLTQSTTILMKDHYGAQAETGDLVIRMRPVSPDEAPSLGVSLNQSVLELEMITYDETGVPFSVGRQVWRGELAEFSAKAYVNR